MLPLEAERPDRETPVPEKARHREILARADALLAIADDHRKLDAAIRRLAKGVRR